MSNWMLMACASSTTSFSVQQPLASSGVAPCTSLSRVTHCERGMAAEVVAVVKLGDASSLVPERRDAAADRCGAIAGSLALLDDRATCCSRPGLGDTGGLSGPGATHSRALRASRVMALATLLAPLCSFLFIDLFTRDHSPQLFVSARTAGGRPPAPAGPMSEACLATSGLPTPSRCCCSGAPTSPGAIAARQLPGGAHQTYGCMKPAEPPLHGNARVERGLFGQRVGGDVAQPLLRSSPCWLAQRYLSR
mmetsp:Transcript_16061/g.40814  ORF Transcript_16061/g.40814 Transcript_16061/m.40814 type:complete len:250 (+) Transcript_16061:257-1006(+)